MGRVQVSSFEVRLAPTQWRLKPPQVAQGRYVVCPIEQLRDADSASAPVACGQRMLETLSYYPRANRSGHVNQWAFDTYALELILYVAS